MGSTRDLHMGGGGTSKAFIFNDKLELKQKNPKGSAV